MEGCKDSTIKNDLQDKVLQVQNVITGEEQGEQEANNVSEESKNVNKVNEECLEEEIVDLSWIKTESNEEEPVFSEEYNQSSTYRYDSSRADACDGSNEENSDELGSDAANAREVMKFLSNKINEDDESVLEDEEDKKINFEESQMEQSVEENQIEEIEEESRIYFKIEEFNSKIENIKSRANIKSNNPPEIVQRKCDLLKAFYENRMEIEPGLTKEETIQKKLKEIEKYENIKEYKEWCDEQNIIQKIEPKRLEKVYIGHGKTKAHFYRSFDGSNYTQADFEYTLECERKETEAKAREARIQAEKEKIEVEKQRLRNNPGCLESVLNWITCSD